MLIEDRRRAFLRELGGWLVKNRATFASIGIEHQSDEHAEQALLLSMPNGAVEFRGGDPDAIPIQRNGITLIVPGDTPCEILDAMFEIAESMGFGEVEGAEALTISRISELVRARIERS